MNRLGRRNSLYLIFILVVVAGFFSIKSINAKFEQGYTTDDDVVDYSFDLEFDINSYSDANSVSTLEEYEVISVLANSYSIFNVDVKNIGDSLLYYGIWYKSLSDVYTDIEVGKFISSSNDTSGSLNGGESKTTTIIIKNNENVNIKVKIGVASNENSISEIGYYDDRKLIEGIISNVSDGYVNEPILSSGMIPVVYNDDSHNWVKARYDNKGNSWYNYYDKKWANVVVVKDSAESKYNEASIGSVIDISDVLAFYVWIPRFKYLVWDINRQTSDVKNYSYDAKSNGVIISFEKDENSSGSVSCNYNYNLILGLFDECVYSGNRISANTVNSVAADAWYTHPAFTSGDKELSGFWIGKFETTGTVDNPTIIPDSVSLSDVPLAEFVRVSKKFNSYGIDNNLESRIIRNVEWGAVTYLSHSLYGLCADSGCSDVYVNNSIDHYTGRSSGSYILDDVYQYGTYSYDGYGTVDGTKDSNYSYGVMASTTGNITGVYDMAGGALEFVMGNIGDSEAKVVVGDNSGNWNNIELKRSDYDLYATIDSVSDGYNRAILGDATSEVSINGFTWGNSDKTNIASDSHWIVRGSGNNIYGYDYVDGGASSSYTFRSVIS